MRVRVRKTLRLRLADDQVDVALPVARLGVGKPVPFVRQRPQRLGKQPQRRHPHRQLPGLGAEQHAGRADEVADVPALEGLVGGAEGVGLQEQLHLAGAVRDLGEARLAHQAAEHASGRPPSPASGWPRARRHRARRSRRAAGRRAHRDGSRWDRRCRCRWRAGRRAWRAARRSACSHHRRHRRHLSDLSCATRPPSAWPPETDRDRRRAPRRCCPLPRRCADP